jgi:gliding motility-associated-like protein
VGLTNVDFAVFDRWGQKMFETTDITRGWDGTYKGKKMDAAVFGYYVKGLCADGENFEKKGNVTLLR